MVLSELEIQILLDNLRFVRREGKYLVFFCPFHDDRNKPNFKVHIEKGTYRCFRCGEYGSVIRLLRRFAPYLFPADEREREESERLKLLEEIYETKMIEDKEVIKEIHERRKISWDVIEKSKVKFLPDCKDIPEDLSNLKRRFIFPAFSFNHRLLNVVGWSPYLKPPYTLPPNLPPKPYGLHAVGKVEGEIYISEGVMDCLSLWDCGCPSIAVLGAGVHFSEIFSLFPTPLVYTFDGDSTGRKYTFLWSFAAVKEKRLHDTAIVLPPHEDPNSLHQKGKLEDVINKTKRLTTPEVIFLYSLKHQHEVSPLMVVQFLAFQLPLTYFLDLYTQLISKHLKGSLKLLPFSLDGAIPSDYFSEHILSDWALICSAAMTEDGRQLLLRYFLPSEIKPILDSIPLTEGNCGQIKHLVRAACKRILYALRKPQYNKFRELIETVKRLERV